MAYVSSPTRASSARTMASVSGRRSIIVVPCPGTERMSIAPPSARTRVYTASTPTPRPERSVTLSAVEKPGRASRRSSSSSVRSVFVGVDEPIALRPLRARVRDRSRLPSSLTSNDDGRAIARRAQHEPAGRPACPPRRARQASRCRGRSRCAADARSNRRSRRASSDRARSPCPRRRSPPACRRVRAASRTTRGKRSNTCATGTMRLAVISSRSSVISRDDCADRLLERHVAELARELRQAAARDHQLADRGSSARRGAARRCARDARRRGAPTVDTLASERGRLDRRDAIGTDGLGAARRRSTRSSPIWTSATSPARADRASISRGGRRRDEPHREVVSNPSRLDLARAPARSTAPRRSSERLHDDERANAAQRRVRREADAHERAGTARRRDRPRSPAAARSTPPTPSACSVRDEIARRRTSPSRPATAASTACSSTSAARNSTSMIVGVDRESLRRTRSSTVSSSCASSATMA